MKTAEERRAVDAFADAGVLCAKQGVLPEAVSELAVRLDIEGCGDLLDELIAQRWEVDPRYEAKKPVVPAKPKPRPKPTKPARPTRKGR